MQPASIFWSDRGQTVRQQRSVVLAGARVIRPSTFVDDGVLQLTVLDVVGVPRDHVKNVHTVWKGPQLLCGIGCTSTAAGSATPVEALLRLRGTHGKPSKQAAHVEAHTNGGPLATVGLSCRPSIGGHGVPCWRRETKTTRNGL